MTCMIVCFRLQAWVGLTPRRPPSSTELIPSLAAATSHMPKNQEGSGSLGAWKRVPAVRALGHDVHDRLRQAPGVGRLDPQTTTQLDRADPVLGGSDQPHA